MEGDEELRAHTDILAHRVLAGSPKVPTVVLTARPGIIVTPPVCQILIAVERVEEGIAMDGIQRGAAIAICIEKRKAVAPDSILGIESILLDSAICIAGIEIETSAKVMRGIIEAYSSADCEGNVSSIGDFVAIDPNSSSLPFRGIEL